MDVEPKASLLVVDDLPANLHFLRNILIKRGYKVRIAPDGEMALRSAQSNPPDLILLDIMLPDTDGYLVCTQLKADPRTRDVPVIFLSALNESLDKVKAFTAGGVDYITKPFQVEEVTARVETHLALRRLQTSLEQQIAELDAFAHTVAHDLKSPLGVLLGYTDILSQELAVDPNPLAQEYLKGVVRSALKMGSIVDELLLLARVRRVEQVAITPLDMAAIVAATQERLAVMIVEYKAEITAPAEWPTALGYKPWVEEIWVNYISNAIKYGGQPPCLELGADIISSSGDDLPEKRQIRFWVRDNGQGLAPAEQERLFTEFTQLRQVRAGGYGLGLSIVQRIVKKLGGQVGVDSQPGQGSTFSFTLPAEAGEPSP